MNLSKTDWYLILFFLLAFVMVSLNELGYGVFALFLLFPASWLTVKAFEKPPD
jgi:peptidoglycan/LPS O-acetylase OafA/YrhL